MARKEKMKKRFGKLSKAEQEKIEAEYHQMKPEEFDELMAKDEIETNDELRPEYDLASLRVRKPGIGRRSFGGTIVRLEPDVAEVFPDAESVNEVLRFLIRIARENKLNLF